ncbi:hypothetical protein BDZ91DRAFT_769093 [Kalaharituber pfeilii]|nr:hypothetical protein BDZ91DRAFT_769093 [Kalaharituber pfeilii]
MTDRLCCMVLLYSLYRSWLSVIGIMLSLSSNRNLRVLCNFPSLLFPIVLPVTSGTLFPKASVLGSESSGEPPPLGILEVSSSLGDPGGVFFFGDPGGVFFFGVLELFPNQLLLFFLLILSYSSLYPYLFVLKLITVTIQLSSASSGVISFYPLAQIQMLLSQRQFLGIFWWMWLTPELTRLCFLVPLTLRGFRECLVFFWTVGRSLSLLLKALRWLPLSWIGPIFCPKCEADEEREKIVSMVLSNEDVEIFCEGMRDVEGLGVDLETAGPLDWNQPKISLKKGITIIFLLMRIFLLTLLGILLMFTKFLLVHSRQIFAITCFSLVDAPILSVLILRIWLELMPSLFLEDIAGDGWLACVGGSFCLSAYGSPAQAVSPQIVSTPEARSPVQVAEMVGVFPRAVKPPSSTGSGTLKGGKGIEEKEEEVVSLSVLPPP